jgi:diguanylate cyclase (GGDEF)-like protein
MGDKIIKKISESIRIACNRASDIAARFGGDEFVVILPQCSLEGAYKVGSSIRRAVEEVSAYFREVISERITVSIGVFSDIPNDANSLHYCIERADRNLYVAKSIGGNIVSIDEAI